MNEPFNFKPEPLPAKSKWHYDSYYLSQLERLNIRQPTDIRPKTEDITEITFDVKSLKMPSVANVSQENERQISKYDEVIKRIYELAASIGISVTIIENSKQAA
jgi:repressor of nif and glnA expression